MENALITGATKGIGRSIALAFAKEGINLAICSRNKKDLQEFKAELLALNPDIQIVTHVIDCSIKQELRKFAALAQQELGFIKILINNVGVFIPSNILDDAEDTFINQVNTNVMPAYELYRFFGKAMMNQRSGHIFNICSVASVEPIAKAGTYGVTKAALYSLNTVMRLEMQEHKVKVTAVLPGSTLTESWAGTDLPPERFVSPDDVALAVLSSYKMSSGANVDEVVIKPVLGQL
ncbi:SDR family oxidoreductase [Mucilaginibacter robiniae]|uniref:SDR family oxidoreductase n=1 Tax=Mucilaginibacter robiniae TaxID=2728022 RepID=A0A7L5E9B7_9SPHI|nr:SDR family oxidoreductase [Mucilaginibacter robiniae]QJD97473.1 SDR family oxidoreductase [Mucilaginibacter robiniae]